MGVAGVLQNGSRTGTCPSLDRASNRSTEVDCRKTRVISINQKLKVELLTFAGVGGPRVSGQPSTALQKNAEVVHREVTLRRPGDKAFEHTMRTSIFGVAILLVPFGSLGCDDASPVQPDPPSVERPPAGDPSSDPDTSSVRSDPTPTSDTSEPQPGDDTSTEPGDAPPASSTDGLPIAELVAATAQAICEGLFRCCPDEDVVQWFAPLSQHPRLEDLWSTFPPNVTLTPETCPATLEDAFGIVPFGPWVQAVADGLADYDAVAAEACLDTLAEASCGTDLLSAMYDSTCLGFGAPAGGDEQRVMFSRSAQTGDPCVPLSDGVGAGIFGTCEPSAGFCCVTKEGQDDCSIGAPLTEGICVPASQVGEACSVFPVLQVCATGLECNLDNICELPSQSLLTEGDLCYENFSLLGSCQDSWCDLLGTSKCESFIGDGEPCTMPESCLSGACSDGTCGALQMCIGR